MYSLNIFQGNSEEIIKELTECFNKYKDIGKLTENDINFITEVSMLCNSHACLLLQGGLLDDAYPLLIKSLQLTAILVQSNPNSLFSLQSRSSSLYNMGKYEECLNHLPQCLTYYMRCLESDEVINHLSQYSPLDRGVVDDFTIASDYLNVARILNLLNKPTLTKEYITNAIQKIDNDNSKNKDKPAIKRVYVSALYNLGIIEEQLNNVLFY